MKKFIALVAMVVAIVALAGCGLPDLSAPDKPAERPAKTTARRPKVSTTTTLSSDWGLRPSTTTTTVVADTTTTVAPADTPGPSTSSAPSTGVAGNAPVAPSSGSSGGATSTPIPASIGQAPSASVNQPAAGTSTGGDTGTCAYPGRCTSDPHRNGEVGRSGQVAGTTATPVGAGGE